MDWQVYLFEAKSIQAYILDSGKLRDLVGASELVDSLCGAALDDALAALGLSETLQFSRRAGGAFYGFSEQPQGITALATLWPLVVQQYAPGLAFDHATGSGDSPATAFADARAALRRNGARQGVTLPQAGPLIHRSQRTGRAAVDVRRLGTDLEVLDANTRRQRHFSDLQSSKLIDKLRPDGAGLQWRDWPLNLDATEDAGSGDSDPQAFPFTGDNRTIAVMHADGNGLGQLLMTLAEQLGDQAGTRFIDAFRALSEGIDQATVRAAREAVQTVLLPARDESGLIAARPVVLGGDDLTMILRADLALPFTQRFLAAFERHSEVAMAQLHASSGARLPPRLTACAGIAYIKASQPFQLAATLAEGITAAVKCQAKALDPLLPPSSLAFHRVTTAMIDDYASVLQHELSHGGDELRFCNSLGAYAVEPGRGLPALDDLLALQRLLDDPAMARGAAREVLTLIAQSPQQATTRFQRWRTLMGDARRGDSERLQQFDALIERLLMGADRAPGGLPYCRDRGDPAFSGPLGDVHALSAIGNQTPDDDTDGEEAA